jgi:hypothetical protein
MIRDVKAYESRKAPILNKTFVPCRPALTIPATMLAWSEFRKQLRPDKLGPLAS